MSIHPLSAQELLNVWEQAVFRPPLYRALLLLAAALPERSLQAVAELSLGQRDAYLLALREQTFGPQLVSLATCPACNERVELTFKVSDIRVAPEPEPAQPLALAIADYEVQFRLPNSLDLLALGNPNNSVSGQTQLLERCLLAATYQSEAQSAEQLPADVIEAIAAKMAQADPQADVELALTCPACTQPWQANFDISSFFWEEINVWAYRTLREVHLLASAYSWSEAEILALSPWKRQFYLKMINGS